MLCTFRFRVPSAHPNSNNFIVEPTSCDCRPQDETLDASAFFHCSPAPQHSTRALITDYSNTLASTLPSSGTRPPSATAIGHEIGRTHAARWMIISDSTGIRLILMLRGCIRVVLGLDSNAVAVPSDLYLPSGLQSNHQTCSPLTLVLWSTGDSCAASLRSCLCTGPRMNTAFRQGRHSSDCTAKLLSVTICGTHAGGGRNER
ncbi:hypothetical protein C8Q77DRAFT_432085 [Trametes polyzona]|nr:hypothetical protein C8Q77DRAFT_432085 [Trametes polyzona]